MYLLLLEENLLCVCVLITGSPYGNITGYENQRESSEENDEEEYGKYLQEICAIPGAGHRVLVIQPGTLTNHIIRSLTLK